MPYYTPSLFLTLLLIVLCVEWILQITWSRPYYTTGILLFSCEREFPAAMSTIPDDQDLEEGLRETRFRDLLFRSLDEECVAFRQKTWSNGRVWYGSIMHGHILFDLDRSIVSVRGYLDWRLVVMPFVLVLFPMTGVDIGVGFILFFFAVSALLLTRVYRYQNKQFTALADAVADTWSDAPADLSVLP